MSDSDCRNVLVLEHEPIFSGLLLSMLTHLGYKGLLATNIQGARELSARSEIYAALLDIQVPETMSGPELKWAGWEYAFQLREEKPNLRVALQSTMGLCYLDSWQREELKAKRIMYLKKPVEKSELEKFLS